MIIFWFYRQDRKHSEKRLLSDRDQLLAAFQGNTKAITELNMLIRDRQNGGRDRGGGEHENYPGTAQEWVKSAGVNPDGTPNQNSEDNAGPLVGSVDQVLIVPPPPPTIATRGSIGSIGLAQRRLMRR